MSDTKVNDKSIKDCFIICPIGAQGSDIRTRSDALLKHIYTPVLSKYGYRPVRADQIPKAGLITTQIINLVIEAPMVIADLSGANPNVFYELAIRHAAGKPCIQLTDINGVIPFDISGVRTLKVDIQNLDSVEECKKEIGEFIEHFHSGHKADSPISVAANVKLLQSDPKYVESLLNKLEQMHGFGGWVSIDDLGDKLDDIERKLDDIESKLGDM